MFFAVHQANFGVRTANSMVVDEDGRLVVDLQRCQGGVSVLEAANESNTGDFLPIHVISCGDVVEHRRLLPAVPPATILSRLDFEALAVPKPVCSPLNDAMISGVDDTIAVSKPLGNAFVDSAFLENLLELRPGHASGGVPGGEEGKVGGGGRGEYKEEEERGEEERAKDEDDHGSVCVLREEGWGMGCV